MMTRYEKLVTKASTIYGATVLEIDLGTDKPCGKCIDNIIILNSNNNLKEKYSVLSEELGHYITSNGDIIDQDNIVNRKQEIIARRWGYKHIIGIIDLINSYRYGCKNRHEISEYLEITEEFLNETLAYYKCQYPEGYEIDNYWVDFSNGLEIFEKF